MTDEQYYSLKPTQPYFVFDTIDFRQEIYLRDGISHFYTFRTDAEKPHRLVPDGCIEIIFEYDPIRPGHMHSYVCGTKLSYEVDVRNFHSEIFGVRFMPGNHPDMLNVSMKNLQDHRFDLKDVICGDTEWIGRMAKETDFYERMKVFLEFYSEVENKKRKEKYYGKKELLQAVKNFVYAKNGNIKIRELETFTNYSERYINKVFIDEMGFPPKTFCKIIQFQKALEVLNRGRPENMTETAVNLGYYDQSQFIKDFTKFCGTTPLKYLKMRKVFEYQQRAN